MCEIPVLELYNYIDFVLDFNSSLFLDFVVTALRLDWTFSLENYQGETNQ